MINKLIGFCILIAIGQSSFASTINTLFGSIYNPYTHYSHHYILSNNDHNKWQLIHPLDDSLKKIDFISTTCAGKNCLSLASHRSSNNTNVPVILSSQDGGENWSQIKYINGIHTKLNYLQGQFLHAVCYEQRCFASGLVKDVVVNDKSYSLIISEDGGMTWSIPQNLNNKDLADSLPRLDLYCNKNQCVSRSTDVGDFLISQNKGENWKLVKFTLPNSQEFRINDLKVSDQNFVAVGYSHQSDKTKPLIIISTDGGLTWQVKVDEINVGTHHITRIDHLSCNKNICLAPSSDRENAILMLSRDAGVTWQAYSTSDKAPDEAISMIIKKSICTDNACAIIGKFNLSRGSRPLIATLNLHEKTYKYHLTSSTLNPDIAVNDINCSHSKCYVAGNFDNYPNDGNRYKENTPALFESDDLMMSWKDISDKNYILKRGDQITISSMATPN